MKLYTWKDVERCFRLNIDKWSDKIMKLEVYPEKLYIYSKENRNEILSLISSVLNCRINDKDDIELEIGNERLRIIIEQVYEMNSISKQDTVIPLFRNILYHMESAYDKTMISSALKGVPVIAFHSYKGGVGRTLSLISFVKAWTEREGRDKTLLIIDADIEAPGLSWIYDDYNRDQSFSYLDLLEMAQLNEDAFSLVKKIKDIIKTCTFSFESRERVCTQYFMPTHRYDAQLLDIYASPQSIAQGYNKQYFLGDVLSVLGKELQIDAVIIDLRAGMSEFSAPILFDPRIKKYIVSSTSYQSCIGTKLLLDQMLKGININEDSLIPEILLTMVQNNENTEDIHELIRKPYELNTSDDKQDLLDHIIYDLDFASELIKLDSLQEIMTALDDRRFYEKIRNIVETDYLPEHLKTNETRLINDRDNVIGSIHRIAKGQLTAEGNEAFPVMKTRAINQLVSIYGANKPIAVIMGAKGAGKTYLYREILKRKYWERFVNYVGNSNYNEKTIVVPLLATESIANITKLLGTCLKEYNELLGENAVDITYYQKNRTKARDMLQNNHSITEWAEFWKDIMVPEKMSCLEDLDELCNRKGSKVLFLVDGLEELFTNTLTVDNEKRGVSSLCKDVIGELQIKYDNISCLVFTRKDIIKNAISINFEQFASQYKGLELNWSKTEALRLALWLVSEVEDAFKEGIDNIEDAADSKIRRNLEKLWGLKLGKDKSNEAYSSNWIIAALSDFNGQLQARDIIRFLEYATYEAGSPIYDDRYIMPKDIKNAIPKCSQKKIEEIEQEIEILNPIFQKLRDASENDKKLPFASDDLGLSNEEAYILAQEGYLYNDMGKCYLPEIIRHALGFSYSKGARPKVLALMARKI